MNFEYFYNPIFDILNLKSGEIMKNIKLYNSIGQLVLDKNINNYVFTTDLSLLPTSIYFVKVESQNGIKSFKLRVK